MSTVGRPRRPLIDRRRGLWLGVCRGLADHADMPVGLVRLGVVFLTVAGLGLPGILAYIAAGLLLDDR